MGGFTHKERTTSVRIYRQSLPTKRLYCYAYNPSKLAPYCYILLLYTFLPSFLFINVASVYTSEQNLEEQLREAIT